MQAILQALEPRSKLGVFGRFVGFTVLIACFNVVFALAYDGELKRHVFFYVIHAAFVGGPFVVFFLFVMMVQVRLQRRLSRLSRKDALTGLNNRRSFFELADRRRLTEKDGVLLLIDADHFKAINDSHGHLAGDSCLEAIAYMLRRNTRETDVLGRIGGEEFALLLAGASLPQARAIAERLTQPIPFRVEGNEHHLSVTLSIGATIVRDEKSLDALIAEADSALYQAKAAGRARLHVHDRPCVAHANRSSRRTANAR